MLLTAALSGCDRLGDAEDTGIAGPAVRIPVTTASQEARDHYLIGRDLMDKLRVPEARRHLVQAVARDSTFAIAHYELALSEPTNRGFLEHLTRAVDLSEHASDGERLTIMALHAGAHADPAEQRRLTEQLAVSYPLDPRAHFLLGFSQAGQQEFDAAIASFTRATELDPEFSPAWNALGYAYRPLGRYAEAERAFKQYIALLPREPNPYDSYAELLMKVGRHDESIAMYRKALEADSHFVPSFVGIAANFIYSGRHGDALGEARRLEKIARDDRERRVARLTAAIVWADRGNTAQALKELEARQNIARRSRDTLAMAEDLTLMGELLLESGRAGDARRRFEQALALVDRSRTSPEIQSDARLRHTFHLARVALRSRDLARARALADSFADSAGASRNPDRIRQAEELLGLIALAEGNGAAAAEHLASADQQDPFVLFAQAQALALKGERDQARELFAKVATHNDLPTLRYVLVRRAAGRKAGAG
jgi:tetratricopeptide (TPR) repeat protein